MTVVLGYGLYLVPGLAQVAWAGRLWCLRLLSRYPFLFLYLVFSTLSSMIVLTAHLYRAQSNVYGWLFLVMQPVGWTLLLCVVLEIYQRMTEGYEGLRRLGGLVMLRRSGHLSRGVDITSVARQTGRESGRVGELLVAAREVGVSRALHAECISGRVRRVFSIARRTKRSCVVRGVWGAFRRANAGLGRGTGIRRISTLERHRAAAVTRVAASSAGLTRRVSRCPCSQAVPESEPAPLVSRPPTSSARSSSDQSSTSLGGGP